MNDVKKSGDARKNKGAHMSGTSQTSQMPQVKVSARGGSGAVISNEVPFTITSVSKSRKYLKALIYGKHGVGKTTVAGSSVKVPGMRDVIMIDAEAGDLSLIDMEDIDIVRVSTYRQVARVIDFLRIHCKYRDEDNVEGLKELEARLRGVDVKEIETPRKYRTLIIDSLSEVESFCMYQLLGITDNTRLDAEVASPEFSEYKRNYNMIQRLIRSARNLPMHVIFTCPDQFIQDDLKRFVYMPNLTGRLSKEVHGFMDLVGFLVLDKNEEGKQVRRLFVQPVGKFEAKNRFPRFKGTYIDNPDMSKIVDAMELPVNN